MVDALTDWADPRIPEQKERERVETMDPRWRYYAGFDRWSHSAMAHREITVAASNSLRLILDGHEQIWFWDQEWKIWLGIGNPAEAHLHAENRVYVAAMRRAAPVIRLLAGTQSAGERSAAQEALRRLARSVRRLFQASPTGRFGSSCWIGAAGLYHDITRRNQWQISDLDLPPWDEAIENELREQEEGERNEFAMRMHLLSN